MNKLLPLLMILFLASCTSAPTTGTDATVTQCESTQLMCSSGDQCITTAQVCNDWPDCDDGSDEIDCGCPVDWVDCNDGRQCIYGAFVCDGVFNCDDHSDENGC